MEVQRRKFLKATLASSITGLGNAACTIFTDPVDPVTREPLSNGAAGSSPLPAAPPSTQPPSRLPPQPIGPGGPVVAPVVAPIAPVAPAAPVAQVPPDPRLSPTIPFQVGTQLFAANRFQQALDALPAGGTLMILGGATYNVTGILRATNATIKGVRGKAEFTGLNLLDFPAQGKALIVQTGAAATYEDLRFSAVAVSGKNGAGVRLEAHGRTVFRRCEFRDSQEGILTFNSAPQCHLYLEDCVGVNLGAGDGYSHGLYAGTIGSLTILRGSWTDTNVGHLIKSRAGRTRLEGVTLIEGRASRAVDCPSGGVVEILDCTIEQDQRTSNENIIGYGLEVAKPLWAENSFTFRANNRVTNARNEPSVFQFAAWASAASISRVIEPYSYNGNNEGAPGVTG